MSSKAIAKRRDVAFANQSGCCYYCRKPMWRRRSARFARVHRLTAAQLTQRRCTAEHLLAQCDGGLHGQENIAAACLFCNQKRHRLPIPPDPAAYMLYVRQEQLAGRWPTEA